MPSDNGIEQYIIGSVLLHNGLFSRVGDIVEDDHFHQPLHRKLWEIIRQLIERGKTATPRTVKRFLGQDQVEGEPIQRYLAHLCAEGGGTVASIVEHAIILRDLHLRRCLISAAMSLAEQCFSAAVDATVESIMGAHDEEMATLRPKVNTSTPEFVSFDQAAQGAVDAANDAYANPGAVIGLPTGLHNLDLAIGGLQRSDLLVVAGRPGMGKTALATNIGFNVAMHMVESHVPGVVAFYSLEMSSQQLAARILAEQSQVEGWRVRRGKVGQDEIERFIGGARSLRNMPMAIDDRGHPTIYQLAIRARALHKRRTIALLVVDYLQLIRGDSRERNRVQEISEITAGLKGIAKELSCPVLALSQLSRALESRDDKRPQLSDLRESGSIEQDADAVLMIYREAYYLERAEPRHGTQKHTEWQSAMEQAQGRADILVAKNRHGPLAKVELGWDAQLTRFHNDPPVAPEPLAKEPRTKAEKAKSFSKDATHCHSVLKGMALQAYAPTKEQCAADSKLDPNARLLPVDSARQAYGKQYGGDITEAKLRTEFTRICKELYQNGLLKWTGAEGSRYIWLPESVRKQ